MPHALDDMRQCRKCGERKAMSSFSVADKNGNRRHTCMACRAHDTTGARRAWGRAHPDYDRQKHAEYAKKVAAPGFQYPDRKRCPKCGEEKTSDHFYLNHAQIDGLDPYCIPCRNAYKAQYKQRD